MLPIALRSVPYGLIVLCVVLRVVPHPPNFAPVGATAVFAGRNLPRGLGVAVTLAAMFAADVALGAIHGWPIFGLATAFGYAGFTVQVLLGRALRRRRGGAVAAAVLGACAFFALSNLGVWVAGGYPPTGAGLAACYLAALPYFGGTLAGDVLWTVVLALAYRPLARLLAARGAWQPETPII